MPNAQLERDVLDELLWDESIDPSRINVSASSGEVMLCGFTDRVTVAKIRRVPCRRTSPARSPATRPSTPTGSK
jgi:hypothetical protein